MVGADLQLEAVGGPALRRSQRSGEIVGEDPERVGTVALATLQGLASLANNGMLGEEGLDELVEEAVDRLVLGLRPR